MRIMTLKEAHKKAVHKDRKLRVEGQILGFWYQDHVLDFVAEHGDKMVQTTLVTGELVAVKLI